MRQNTAAWRVRKLLEKGFRGNPTYYRDNDRRLILKVWEEEGLVLNPDQREKFLYSVSFPDLITRIRRSLRGEFPDSPKVQEKRFKLFRENLERFSKKGILRRYGKGR